MTEISWCRLFLFQSGVAFAKIELSVPVVNSHGGEVEQKRRGSNTRSESENILSSQEVKPKEMSTGVEANKDSYDGLYDVHMSASRSKSHHEDEIIAIP
jgi:hypothetical protein